MVFFNLDTQTLSDGYIGTGARTIKSIFKRIKQAQVPTILLIDEIDSIGCKRDARTCDERRAMLNALLVEISRLKEEKNKLILVIGVTNTFDDLDPAIKSRFGRAIELSLPNPEQRLKIIKYHAEQLSLAIPEHLFKNIVDLTHNFSGRDLSHVLEQVKHTTQGAPYRIQAHKRGCKNGRGYYTLPSKGEPEEEF